MSVRFKLTSLLLTVVVSLTTPAVVLPQTRHSGIEIVAVGDILLDRGIRQSIERFGTEYPFEMTTGLLTGADLAFGNLENPLTDECQEQQKKYVFKADPAHAEILRRAGFDILSLANNHTADCGQVGLENTFEALAGQKLRYAGAAVTGRPNTTVILDAGGLKIGFAAFTAISAGRQGTLFSWVSNAEPDNVFRAIAELREATDIVIVSFHWGTEYALKPNADQIRLARHAVGSGADIVLGHHPHVLQGIETIERGDGERPALVAYSLGNFVFDSPVRLNRLTGESMILKLRVNGGGISEAEIVPIVIEDRRPVIATGVAKDTIQKRIERLSKGFGTRFDGGKIVMTNDLCAKGSDRR